DVAWRIGHGRQTAERKDHDQTRKTKHQRKLQKKLRPVAKKNLPPPPEQHCKLRRSAGDLRFLLCFGLLRRLFLSWLQRFAPAPLGANLCVCQRGLRHVEL